MVNTALVPLLSYPVLCQNQVVVACVPGSFIAHTWTKAVYIKPNVTNKIYLLHR
jgi:hypothetical protein